MRPKGLIGPHAGLSYCGSVGAFGYVPLRDAWGGGNHERSNHGNQGEQRAGRTEEQSGNVKRIVLLGPSHHVYSTRCWLTTTTAYDTPLGPLPIDLATVASLRETGMFDDMERDVDEHEHSMELHCPYIRYCFPGPGAKGCVHKRRTGWWWWWEYTSPFHVYVYVYVHD